MAEKAVHAIVYGRVQGVWFRESTRNKADELGLRGWVRNLEDGSVETYFCGSVDSVAAMKKWLHIGSPASRVDTIQFRDEPVEDSIASFVITR